MKSLITICLVLFASATAAVAQRGENYPAHSISKDVQKIQFRNTKHVSSRVITAHLHPSSKEVTSIRQRGNKKFPVVVTMNGMPSTVISKEVARMQFERSKK
jgi:hypothetical protein